jgi:hypothetical protein
MRDVSLVNPPDLHLIWGRVMEIFDAHTGLKEQFTPGELLIHLLNGTTYQLWVGVEDGDIEALLVTATIPYVNGNKLHIVGVAADHLLHKYIETTLSKLEQYGCIMNVDEIIFDGRPGWKRVMQKFGYRETLQMRKNVRMLTAH